jgi:hypothetical protein
MASSAQPAPGSAVSGTPAPQGTGVIEVRGAATPDEVAALVMVLAAATGGSPAPAGADRWVLSAGALRGGLQHGPGAWQRAFRS